MRVTRWDGVLFLRAWLVAMFALVATWLVTAASDEGSVAWGERAGRTLPLTPLCAAFGAWVALAPVRARGESTAMQALGRRPAEVAAGAVVGGAILGLTAALALATVPAIDISGFYPTATRVTAWRWHDGAFEDPSRGVRMGADGTPGRVVTDAHAPSAPVLPHHGRAAAALAVALATVALTSLLAQHPLGGRARGRARDVSLDARAWPHRLFSRAPPNVVDALTSLTALAASVALFQASAAHRLSALAGAAPPFALLALALWRYRSRR